MYWVLVYAMRDGHFDITVGNAMHITTALVGLFELFSGVTETVAERPRE